MKLGFRNDQEMKPDTLFLTCVANKDTFFTSSNSSHEFMEYIERGSLHYIDMSILAVRCQTPAFHCFIRKKEMDRSIDGAKSSNKNRFNTKR